MTQLNLIAEDETPEIYMSGLTYVPDFITATEHDFLLSQIDQQAWLTDLKNACVIIMIIRPALYHGVLQSQNRREEIHRPERPRLIVLSSPGHSIFV